MLMQRVEPSRKPARWHIRRAAWVMLARCATALVGGYVAAAVLATLLARVLPVAPVEATVWGMISGFLIYAVIGLWCFHEPRLTRVVGVIWGVAALGGAALWLLGVRS